MPLADQLRCKAFAGLGLRGEATCHSLRHLASRGATYPCSQAVLHQGELPVRYGDLFDDRQASHPDVESTFKSLAEHFSCSKRGQDVQRASAASATSYAGGASASS